MNTENENKNEVKDEIKNSSFFQSYKKWIVIALLVIVSTAGIGTYAFAKMHRLHKDGPLGFIIDKMTKGLDLSTDQKAQVERLKSTIKEKMEAQKNSKEKDNDADELINAFRNSNLDRNKLNNLEQKHSAKEVEMKEFTKDKVLEFYNILTPSQRTKAADKMSEMKNMMHDKMEKFHHDKDDEHGKDHK